MRSRQFVPRRERVGGRKTKCAAEIDDAQAGIAELGCVFRGDFMRGSKKSGARIARDDRIKREGAEGSLGPRAQPGKHLRKAMEAVGFAHIEGGWFYFGMAEQQIGQLETGIASDTNDGNAAGVPHFTCDSIFLWRDSRDFLLVVMIRTVSSPAMVPTISGNFAASTAAARGCAPLGGVFNTSRFSAGRMSSRNSPSARVSGGTAGVSSAPAFDGRYPVLVLMSCSSWRSRESVAWVTRRRCCARRRRRSSWLEMRSALTRRRICPWRNVFVALIVLYASY